MPLPRFTAEGFLPPGIHTATMAEVAQRLGFSAMRRTLIHDGLDPVAHELVALEAKYLYLGGSFVTDKLSPDDIDGYVTTLLQSPLYEAIVHQQELWRTQHRVDLHPAATDLEGYGSAAYFEEWFGKTADEPPKSVGIVKLHLRG